MKANLNDRASLEQLYPRDKFRQDAGQNSVGKASVLHGLRIMSQPDETGSFELVVAKRQVGERDPEGDTVFLPAFLKSESGGTEEQQADYGNYLDRVLEAARAVDFKSAIGDDARLAGFHGG
ncbi:hypothetical protein [uncultured Enterovirga sp.]|uniref:hypothetical protein n=1 Tax=uncultured Enterovirga sp. TaxID=2026352 RepID=UPI0035CB5CC6